MKTTLDPAIRQVVEQIGKDTADWTTQCETWLAARKSGGAAPSAITDAHTFTSRLSRAQAALAMRQQLGPQVPGELLADGLGDSPRTDAAERAAWSDWTGARLSPKRILGEGLMAATAWQCVAACDAVAGSRFAAASVSLVGSNQQAIGARVVAVASGIPA